MGAADLPPAFSESWRGIHGLPPGPPGCEQPFTNW